MKVSELITQLHELLVKHGGHTEVVLYNEYSENCKIDDDEVNYSSKSGKIIIGFYDKDLEQEE